MEPSVGKSKRSLEQIKVDKENCLDNSVMEHFFGRLKTEMFSGEHFRPVNDFERKLDDYICDVNHDRISLERNGMSPVQYRTHSA